MVSGPMNRSAKIASIFLRHFAATRGYLFPLPFLTTWGLLNCLSTNIHLQFFACEKSRAKRVVLESFFIYKLADPPGYLVNILISGPAELNMLKIETYKIEEVSNMIKPDPVAIEERKHILTEESRGNYVSPTSVLNAHWEKAPTMKRRPASFALSTFSGKKYTPSVWSKDQALTKWQSWNIQLGM